MSIKGSKKLYVGLIFAVILLGAVIMRSGIVSKNQTNNANQAVAVKAMQVVTRDTPVSSEFVGQVKAKNEVKIMSKVSGNIIAKMVNGGDTVYKGQPLFQIDNKQYQSAIVSARASLNKAQATLNNTQKDVERYQRLASVKGVAQQTVDAYVSQAEEDAATVEVNRAALQQASENEQDTLIVSPVDGRIDVNDVSLGYYVAAGSTTMATVSSIDPVWVQFSMSENEYLKFIRSGNGSLPASFKEQLKLILSDGKEYPLSGHVEQIDRGISDTTGTITMKASFDNPQHFLLPGMFARVVVQETVRQGALLIPQKAVKQVLDNTFVLVVTDDNKAESRQVKLGDKIGDMWLVEEGLSANDRVVVEGIDKAKQGSSLQVTMIEPDALTPAKQ
ncbi:efflux RND transporter periplasmic adaptor subunit [Sporomusa sp. KB1]|uniref:efflux RND transporter periplasmic adaptor subunit n=1 Tax=Sporomusa sp. KB1 TaxID=943346 RepID=UPI0011AAC532|nr:efflux RND transporter periplasmic adaptor subunit [Sporomusa sp. KB1]TWH47167.1 membrane fusion protein (multidrug efflux system) [Sporomusa sp. KB1]